MEIKNIFRIILLSTILFPILGIVMSELTVTNHSQEIQDLLEWDGYEGVFWMQPGAEELSSSFFIGIGALLLLVIALIITYVGLFLFKPWSRTLIVILAVITLISSPFMGVFIALPILTTLNEISSILFGVVLAMIYLQPLSDEFKKSNKAI